MRIAEPMYIVMVEFGASRGMGAIVGVKAKTPEGEWVELYKGKALINERTLTLSSNPNPDPNNNPHPDPTPTPTPTPHQAQISENNEYTSKQDYWKWAPAICRTHFLATDFRVEVNPNLSRTPTPTPSLSLSLSPSLSLSLSLSA